MNRDSRKIDRAYQKVITINNFQKNNFRPSTSPSPRTKYIANGQKKAYAFQFPSKGKEDKKESVIDYTKLYDYDDYISVYNGKLISSVIPYAKNSKKIEQNPVATEKNFYKTWINYLE